jgi:hypothetical protein
VRVRLSPAEADAVGAAARREGLSAGAWVGQLAVGRARGQADPVPVTWQDVVTELVRFRVEVSRAVDLVEQVPPGGRALSPVGVAGRAGELLCWVDTMTAAAVAAAGRPGRAGGTRGRRPGR